MTFHKPDYSIIKIKADIPIILFLVLWILLGIITSVAIYYMAEGGPVSRFIDAAKFFILIVGAGFVAITFYCQWKMLSLTFSQNQYLIESQRHRTALDLLLLWNSEQMEKKRSHYRYLRSLKSSKSDEDMVKLITQNKKYRYTIMDIANYFEVVGIEIDCENADEKILKQGLQPLLRSIKDTYNPWFKHLKNTDPDYYAQFGPFFDLLDKWK